MKKLTIYARFSSEQGDKLWNCHLRSILRQVSSHSSVARFSFFIITNLWTTANSISLASKEWHLKWLPPLHRQTMALWNNSCSKWIYFWKESCRVFPREISSHIQPQWKFHYVRENHFHLWHRATTLSFKPTWLLFIYERRPRKVISASKFWV